MTIEFQNAMREAGLTPPSSITPGKIHRFSANGKPGDKAGWCRLFDDREGGVYGNHREGVTHTWQAKRDTPRSPAEQAEFQTKVAAERAKADAERAKVWKDAAARAASIWDAATPAPEDHPYLVKKGILPHSARSKEGSLIIPIFDIDGTIISIQYINPDGSKKFMPGGRVKGGYFTIGGIPEDSTISIVEGFATGATVHEATGFPVVVAFDCGKLLDVAINIRAKYPKAQILIAGDDDHKTEGNPGRTKAKEAAKAVNGTVALPKFTDEEKTKGFTDWNDLAQSRGLDAVVIKAPTPKAIKLPAGLTGTASSAPIMSDGDTQDHPRDPEPPPWEGIPFGDYDSEYCEPAEGEPTAANSESFLLVKSKKGRVSRIIESKAAKVIADRVSQKLAYDIAENSFYLWSDGHWEPQITNSRATSILTAEVDTGCGEEGYRKNYLDGIVSLLCCGNGLPLPPMPEGRVIPFKNGLLDLATKVLNPSTPSHALTWSLPYDYSPGATCPNIREWLLTACDGDQETMLFLINWLAALVFGVELQKFLLLLGPGGTGKGTFQRLAVALVGELNVGVTNLAKLETGTFEAARLFGKRLAMVNEAGKHGGSLNVLKAITGGDAIPLERKNVQQTGSFVFRGLVLMAGNEQLQSSDLTSGLERRRITVEFKRRATLDEKLKWDRLGGEDAVLHSEIPGLVNWLMTVDPKSIRETIDRPPQRIAASNLLGMSAGNSVADWLMERCAPEKDAWLQIGVKEQTRDEVTKMPVFIHADDRAYPSYLTFCAEGGRSYPVALRRFAETVVDILAILGHPVKIGHHPRDRWSGVKGLCLRRDKDPVFTWISASIPSQTRATNESEGCEGFAKGPIPSQTRATNGCEGIEGIFRKTRLENNFHETTTNREESNGETTKENTLTCATPINTFDSFVTPLSDLRKPFANPSHPGEPFAGFSLPPDSEEF